MIEGGNTKLYDTALQAYDEMKKNGDGKKKETPTELKKKAREQYAPFVKESVNVLLDMVMLGSSQSSLQALHTGAGGMPGR